MAEPVSLFVFSVDATRLALPVAVVGSVLEACEAAPLPAAPASVTGAFNLRGAVVPVLDLRPRLGRPARALRGSDYFVIVQAGGRTLALAASDVEGVLDIAADAIVATPPHADSERAAGGLVLLDDGLLLIEDPEAFLAPEELRMLADALDDAVDGA